MRRSPLRLLALFLCLSACSKAETSDAPLAPPKSTAAPAVAAGPATFANVIANPAAYLGQPMEFKVTLVVGRQTFADGGSGVAAGQSWESPPGAAHSVAPDAELKNPPEGTCIFLVANDDRTPVLPLEPIVFDNVVPCLVGSAASPVITGKVKAGVEAKLVVDGQSATVKGLTLSDFNFKAPY